MNTWQIGDVKVTRVVEMEVPGGTRFLLPQATPEAVLPIEWLAPHFMTPDGKLIMSVHALVVETPDKRIVVDTCIGNDKKRSIPTWNNLQLPFLEDLAKAGYSREDIDTVLCTHLHVDHVGWNTMLVDGAWVPTFPNARYLIAKEEFDYWQAEVVTETDTNAGVFEDSVQPVFDAGLVDLVAENHQVCNEVWLEPTPGHTRGHVSIRIESGGQSALITGDAFHHPCQMVHTEWASTADYDQSASTRTREDMLATYGNSDVLVIGTHFATPTAGHIRKGPAGYWLDVGDS